MVKLFKTAYKREELVNPLLLLIFFMRLAFFFGARACIAAKHRALITAT
jgi:hypothetical protein